MPVKDSQLDLKRSSAKSRDHTGYRDTPLALLRSILVPTRHHIDEGHALLLFAILKRCHEEITRCGDDIDVLPGATQPYLLDFTGFKDRTKLTRKLEPLREGGYIIAAEIHSPSARKKHDGAMVCYEINPKTAITNRATASVLLTLLDLAQKKDEGAVTMEELIGALQTRDKEMAETLLGDDQYCGKITELVEDSEHIERVAAGVFRPRLRLYLERRYLMLLNEQPSYSTIKKRFADYLNRERKAH